MDGFNLITYIKRIVDDNGLNFVCFCCQERPDKYCETEPKGYAQTFNPRKSNRQIVNLSRGHFYSIFKSDFRLETFLTWAPNVKHEYNLHTSNMKY